MPPLPTNRLSLLPFPQRWDGRAITLRAVVLFRGSPFEPLMPATGALPAAPPFADAKLDLSAAIIPSLAQLPNPAAATALIDLSVSRPAGARELFTELGGLFEIDPTIEASTANPRRAGRAVKKLLTRSYQDAFAFAGTRTPFAVTDDSYACALRSACRLKGPPGPPPRTATSWGNVIAFAMRQPALAQRLGLIYSVSVELPSTVSLDEGGWLFLSLSPSSDYASHVAAQPQSLARYAARLPALSSTARDLFAPVLFPVSVTPPPGDFDELFLEAETYDDGFCKIVHAAQSRTADPVGIEDRDSLPAVTDKGVHIGWDDEQLLIWMNRQIADPAAEMRDAPMGVRAYRVDAREQGSTTWHSLMTATGHVRVGTVDLGNIRQELTIETPPVQLDNKTEGEYWLPTYFVDWAGWNLATPDPVARALTGSLPAFPFTAVDPENVKLRYGHTYELRVRLVDLSGGGPATNSDAVNPAPAPVAECRFRRFLRPRDVTITGIPSIPDPLNPPSGLQIRRPRLGYPGVLFAGIPNARKKFVDDADAIRAAVGAGTSTGDAPGLPDPDVQTLEIELLVSTLQFDNRGSMGNPPLIHVYTTTRPFPSDPEQALQLDLEYRDVAQIADLLPAAAGPLPIPTARQVVLRLTPVGKPDDELAYFGSAESRIGRTSEIDLFAASRDERAIFVPDIAANRIRAILLQPDEPHSPTLVAQQIIAGKRDESPGDAIQRLAAELDLDAEGLKLTARPGARVLFGCSHALAHTLGPDSASITFTSAPELTNEWVLAVTLAIHRDWTWDGLHHDGIEVFAAGDSLGRVRDPRCVSPTVLRMSARPEAQPDRSFTRVVFFHAIDPKPKPGDPPSEMDLAVTVKANFQHPPAQHDPDLPLAVHVPVAARPTQTPMLASVGVALSPYVRAADYSSSEPRRRMLWLEFEQAPEHPTDSFFGRMLSYAPDPMLSGGIEVALPEEPPLPINPEFIRVIRPGQSDDRAGLSAAQELIPTKSARHFLLPLPPALEPGSPELFGFFTYEFRLGHVQGWSTAQARFGPALRVTGMQHPAPNLPCEVVRTAEGIVASAACARAVIEGNDVTQEPPATEVWVMLYTQVVQVDGKDSRNVLLARSKVDHPRQVDVTGRPFTSSFAPHGRAVWSQDEIVVLLSELGLAEDGPLSVLAVEVLPEVVRPADPLGADLGSVRILRTSPLVKVPAICVAAPCS